MKCAICGIEIDSVDEGIDDGWIPYVWEGDHEQEGDYGYQAKEEDLVTKIFMPEEINGQSH